MRRRLTCFAFLAIALTTVVGSALPPSLDPEKVRAHVKYLASDELEGRGMNQKGSDLASQYIADQFKSYGLKPAGDDGTYFQQVPMVGVQTLPETTFSPVRPSSSRISTTT
jgi:hypothetical protein